MWDLDPGVVALLIAGAVVYAAGVRRLWARAGRRTGFAPRQVAAFAAGWLAAAVALVSPVAGLSRWLFSVHMVQHELLILVAMPLVVLGRPEQAVVWAFGTSTSTRRRVAGVPHRWPALEGVSRWVTAPAIVWLLHAVALWMWHAPVLYQAALRSDLLHATEHAAFAGTAALFWWSLIHGRHGRLGYGAAVVYVFTTSVQSGVLGALIALAPTPWYPIYRARTVAFGLTPLDDQQIAGLIMWVPAGLVLTAVGLGLFAAWLGEIDRRQGLTTTAERLSARGLKPSPTYPGQVPRAS